MTLSKNRDNAVANANKAKEFLTKMLGEQTDVGKFNTDWDHYDSEGYLIGMNDDGEFINIVGFIDPERYDKPPYK